MNLRLERKIVFVTGSGRGIGLAIAESLLNEGAIVIINSRHEHELKSISQKLNCQYGDRCHYFAGDMLDEKDVKKAFDFVEKTFGSLDCFVANLGNGKPSETSALSADEWKRFYDINVLANIGPAGHFYELLKKGNAPSVLFISSIVAKETVPAPIGYAASKSAILTASKYLSHTWAKDGIRVNCILPGNVFFKGGRWEELELQDPDGIAAYINSQVPMKRFGRPDEIADLATFLLSDRASYITGACISADGGQTNAL